MSTAVGNTLPQPGQQIVVGMSGGVDSSVTAHLLKQHGCRVTGLFMVNWTEDEAGYCSAAEDFQDARRVAEHLDIPLIRVDFAADYRARVFQQFLDDYQAGKTPNPDVLCNREVKFQPFREYALRLGADGIATGHYARIEHRDDGPHLMRSVTEDKDQTYFLSAVRREQLEKVFFPLGGYDKPAVRAMARDIGLDVHRKKDSTGICFIGERAFRAFLARYLKDAPGDIVDEGGQVIGQHPGLHHFTLGQRKGLHIGGRRGAAEAPWYVVAKDAPRRRLMASQDPNHPLIMHRRLATAPFHWINRPARLDRPLLARIRHRQGLQTCHIESVADDGSLIVGFDNAQRAAAPGQYLALYDGMACLGSGELRDPPPPA
ncbi:MAG: tRNA 2-thiouridine(34) synthase MnmA [Polycyclovorans sp.]|nr:tRNA 2-thiouridine(34) synthase MnmA [Polycyclovorans sp.]